MAGVITASEPSWTVPLTGLSPRCFGKLATALRRESVGEARRDCRLKGDGVHHAMLGIARLHNLALAG